ncbi:hypothetical protein H0H93_012814, partial [Arthromyces matolae]
METLDSARFKAALEMFPRFFAAGGWMALAATHYNFIREIPMLSSYEVRMSIGGWDHKWFYVIAKFVTKPKSKTKVPTTKTPKALEAIPLSDTATDTDTDFETPTTSTPTNPNEKLFSASLRTDNQTPPVTRNSTLETSDALKAVSASLSASGSGKTRGGKVEPEREEDGAILHTITVSQLCFKIGRITVPPALVLAL